MSPGKRQSGVCFGAFELDPRAGELRKSGIRVKLHDKPFQVLLALLEHPGELVTRKELQERLWPRDTFVEFENGLNNAMGRLREALGDTAENPGFIETIPRHGYRFLPEVSGSVPPSQVTGSFRRWPLILALSAAVLTVFVLVFFYARPTNAAVHSIAVLPFRNLGTGTADDYFAAGMTDAVTTDLAELGISKVVSETSVARFKNTKETVPEIARALGVDAVVEGAVLQEGNQVRITVQLIRADTDRHIWADSYERQLTNVLALQDQVAQGIARAIDLKLTPAPVRKASSPRQVSASAYQAYLEGHYFVQKTSDDFFRAKSYFKQSIELDPSFAPAYAGMSDYYFKISDGILPSKEALPKCSDYAEQALSLDPNSPEGHLALANFYFIDWNWTAANQEYQRAIALAPGLAAAHEWYATYLDFMDRKAQSLKEAQRAVELDPLYPHAHNTLAAAAYLSGEYDQSIEQCHQILELGPNDPEGYACVAQFLVYTGKYSEALADLKNGIALTHGDPYFLTLDAIAYARLGQMQQADKLVEEIKLHGQHQYVSPSTFAVAFASMGKEKQAMDDLEECYKLHDTALMTLKIDPFWDPLRKNPRFQQLVREMNYPQ
jgi:TolB-like protein/DNA-binding winged helix-turn-helix (wHTH) protein